MKQFILLVLAVGTSASCASMMAKADFMPFHQGKFNPKGNNASIEILATKPRKDYIELGLITCRDTDDKWDMDQAVKKAKEVGADAILITKKDYLAGVTPFIGTPFNYGIEAVAIKYK